jgi:hypothetical protein
MTPEAALACQIERYRGMTGEERLKIALDLHAFSREIAQQGIRHQFPDADEAEVERRLRERLQVEYEHDRAYKQKLIYELSIQGKTQLPVEQLAHPSDSAESR